MRFARQLAEAVVLGAATVAGARLLQTLSDPYSDARLRASALVDRLREVTR